MTLRNAVCLAMVFAAVLSATTVFAAQSDRRNAAMYYQRAIDRLETLTERERQLLLDYEGPTMVPSPELRAALRKAQPILDDFHRGSLQGYADFQLDHSQGIELLLPHLGPLRNIARIAKADVGVRLHDGDTIGAADRVATMSRSVTHFGDDRVLISSLVGQAVFSLTDGVIQTGIDRAAFDAADALKLLQPLQQLADMSDPFNFLECLAVDQEVVVDLARSFLDNGADAMAFAEIFADDPDDAFAERWLNLTPEDFDLHVQAYDQFMEDVVDVFAIEDPELATQEMDRVVEQYLDSEHNLLASISTAYSHVLKRKLDIDAQLAQRIAALRELVDGDVEPEQVANAAVWYLRGIDLLNKAETEVIDQLRELEMIWQCQLPEELTAMLNDLGGQVVEEFQTGSQIRRCDFSIARQEVEFPLVPRYVPGMRDAFRILQADAIRLMQAGEVAAAVDRLAICYRVIGHLSGDGQLLSALTSHVAFEYTHLLVEAALEAELIDAEQQQLLAAAFERVPRADPFGYGHAVRATREHGKQLMQWFARQFPDEPYLPLAADAISASDGDRLVSLLALHEAFLEERKRRNKAAGNWPAEVNPLPPLETQALADVIELDELDQLREQVAPFIKVLFAGEFDGTIPGLTFISDIAQRRQQARAVMRIAAAMLEPADQFGVPTSQLLRDSESDETP